jgi:hypothetical protein
LHRLLLSTALLQINYCCSTPGARQCTADEFILKRLQCGAAHLQLCPPVTQAATFRMPLHLTHLTLAWLACFFSQLQLLGVGLVAIQGGLGEASALGLCSLYPNQLSLTAWSSGTGFAGKAKGLGCV